jgi:hypothetical protein
MEDPRVPEPVLTGCITPRFISQLLKCPHNSQGRGRGGGGHGTHVDPRGSTANEDGYSWRKYVLDFARHLPL